MSSTWEQDLTDAVYNNDIDTVKHFLQAEEVRQSIGRKEWIWGEAPLHRASALGRTEILRLLTEAGGNLRSYSIHDNEDKMTCLHLAVWCNQADTVRLLLQMGADPTLMGTWLDYTGSPLDFARQYKHQTILDIFNGDDPGKGKTGKTGNPNGGVSRIQTSAVLTGLENLPTKEKALRKAIDLQKRYSKAEKYYQELKTKLARAEKEVHDIAGNPYYLDQDQIDSLTMEIEELKVFSVEVRKILSDRGGSSSASSSRRHGSERHAAEAPGPMEHYNHHHLHQQQ